jgi:hypothetical protein
MLVEPQAERSLGPIWTQKEIGARMDALVERAIEVWRGPKRSRHEKCRRRTKLYATKQKRAQVGEGDPQPGCVGLKAA